jgi:hypothetical protein
MAATNKCLAQSNNSRTGDEATKKSERIYQQRLRFRRSAARRKVRQRASAHFRTVSLGELDMISKTILVFWTVTCFLIAVQVISGDTTGGTWFVIVAQGITWAIVAVPTALIGSLFKKNKEPTPYEKYVLIGAAACAVVLCASALDWKHTGKSYNSKASNTTYYRYR